jgi:hypothetical protein
MSSLLGNNVLAGAAGNPPPYEIDNSVRFNKDDSSYLSRTPSSASNRKTWTMSCWVKISTKDDSLVLMDAGSNPNYLVVYMYQGTIRLYDPSGGGGSNEIYIAGTRLLRDPSAWYHIVVQLDTTESTNTDRVKIYVNNERETAFTQTDWPDEDYESFINNNIEHTINRTGSTYSECYMAEYHFIDGTALTPASFGETNEDTNQWVPKKYSGSYGTNGFYQKYGDSSALGTDSSGNGNTFAVTNLVATDQMIDTPTNAFATMNPIDNDAANNPQSQSYAEGNLKVLATGSGASTEWSCYRATMALPSSGKWYWESLAALSQTSQIGIKESSGKMINNSPWHVPSLYDPAIDGNSYGINGDSGNKVSNGDVNSSYGSVFNTSGGDIIGVAVDFDNDAIYFSINNTWQDSGDPTSGASKTGAAFTSFASGTYSPSGLIYGGYSQQYLNFGADSSFAGQKTAQGNGPDGTDFYYDPPAGYKALRVNSLPDPEIKLPGEFHSTVLYTGTGSDQSITGAGLQPDLVWIKSRNAAYNHNLLDSVRGSHKWIGSNSDAAEDNDPNAYLSSFDSDGFTLDGGGGSTNNSGTTYTSWNWKAGGTASSNTDGSITSTVSANPEAGFSITKATGTGSALSVGHGLSSQPELIFGKCLGAASTNWATMQDNSSPSSILYLNLTNNIGTDSGSYTAVTASTISIGTSTDLNQDTVDFILYAFHSVPGYSLIGKYEGNNNADGVFVYTGFKPSWLMCKASGTGGTHYDWVMYDSVRSTYNAVGNVLEANQNQDEVTGTGRGLPIDLVSNGFKMRSSYAENNSDTTYLYLAFAESPFKYSNAR